MQEFIVDIWSGPATHTPVMVAMGFIETGTGISFENNGLVNGLPNLVLVSLFHFLAATRERVPILGWWSCKSTIP
jgi:hypothetical protein